jgi:hypothetical protein
VILFLRCWLLVSSRSPCTSPAGMIQVQVLTRLAHATQQASTARGIHCLNSWSQRANLNKGLYTQKRTNNHARPHQVTWVDAGNCTVTRRTKVPSRTTAPSPSAAASNEILLLHFPVPLPHVKLSRPDSQMREEESHGPIGIDRRTSSHHHTIWRGRGGKGPGENEEPSLAINHLIHPANIT